MPASDAQTSLRLPVELRDRVAQAAASEGRSLGEEIRRRLEASFGSAPAAVEDQKTASLLKRIIHADRMLREEWTPWHRDRAAFDIFRAAVDDLLRSSRPVPPLEGIDQPNEPAPMTENGVSLFKGTTEDAGNRLAFLAHCLAAQEEQR